MSCSQFGSGNKSNYVIEIEDTGVEISQEQQETLFRNFDETFPLLVASNSLKETETCTSSLTLIKKV